MAKKKVETIKQPIKVYVRTYTKNDGTKLVLRSDEVNFEDMTPKKVREKYNILYLKEVKETVEYVES